MDNFEEDYSHWEGNGIFGLIQLRLLCFHSFRYCMQLYHYSLLYIIKH